MILSVFKCLHFGKHPKYLKDIFNLRSNTYSLRGTDIFSLPEVGTTTYGLNSYSYLADKSWNAIPDHYRTITDFNPFRQLILSYNNIV